MGRRLPPFAAVKAFEAAARYCNFQQAAEELRISPSAVSHQIKALEDFVGMALFFRNNNRLTLTAEGAAYRGDLEKALDMIEASTGAIMRPRGHAELTISLVAPLAELWLIPRLGAFHKAHPHVSVRLASRTSKCHEATPDGVDLAIQYTNASELRENARSAFLFAETIVPVCSPDYLAANGPIRSAAGLIEQTLIYCNWERDEWPAWVGDAGMSLRNVRSWLELDTRAQALQAAKEGLGIAMGRHPYIDDALATGQLVAPLDLPVSTGLAYFLVASERSEGFEGVRQFREWLLSVCPSDTVRQVA